MQQHTPTFYQSSSSSSGDSSHNDDITYGGDNVKLIRPPQQLAKQVGGIASHKYPVLAYEQYILKPLRLASRRCSSCNVSVEVKRTTTNTVKESTQNNIQEQPTLTDYKDSVRDKTKAYRGIREVAFYETLHFASTLGSTSDILSYIEHKSLLSNLGYFDSTALSLAYYARDPVVTSSVQSYTQSLHALANEVQALKQLSAFTSSYFGVVDLEILNDIERSNTSSGLQQYNIMQKPHLLLQNLTAPFRRPNIIDIKMGTQTYEPYAPASKQKREVAKYPQQAEIGFRIVGMRVHNDPSSESDDGSDGEYKCWDKSFGVKLRTRNDVIHAFMTFFKCNDAQNVSNTRHVLKSVIKQLTRIKQWFEEENSTLAFYASSILIVYEDCRGAPQLDVTTSRNSFQDPVLKMIDFAHVCRHTGGDLGYLKGICSLLGILNEIHKSIAL